MKNYGFARIGAALWAAAIVGGLVVGAVGPPSWRDTVANDGPGCPFKSITGVDCPFCGMTRATLALGGGEWGKALDLHPLAPIVVLGSLALLALVVIGRSEALLRGKRPYILLGSVIAIWILRLVL